MAIEWVVEELKQYAVLKKIALPEDVSNLADDAYDIFSSHRQCIALKVNYVELKRDDREKIYEHVLKGLKRGA